MKIAVTTEGDSLESAIDRRFGRAARFLVFDTDTEKFSVHDNTQNLNAAQGAGTQAAQNIIALGAEALITGHCGPKAFRVLAGSGVKIYTTAAQTPAEALALQRENKLEELKGADVEGHWV